jgi:ABC-type amino acid transport system permease subunit
MNRLTPLLALSIGFAALLASPVKAADPAPLRVGAAAVNFAADDKMQLSDCKAVVETFRRAIDALPSGQSNAPNVGSGRMRGLF